MLTPCRRFDDFFRLSCAAPGPPSISSAWRFSAISQTAFLLDCEAIMRECICRSSKSRANILAVTWVIPTGLADELPEQAISSHIKLTITVCDMLHADQLLK